MSPVEVSIVVPAFNKWPVTARCLKSLARSAAAATTSAEILLADDASTDETATAWREVDIGRWALRHLRNERNLGFLRNCNVAAEQAGGAYLCLLNNDVVVEPGWLDRLLATLRGRPDAGAVGPLFLDRNGRILEAGAMVHADGTARQLGHGHSPGDRRYAFVNDVDYVSAACLLMPTELFRELGGFDERYVPAFYEDTDLCLRLAERGLRVLVDPGVRIVHYEGTTHGTAGGLKRFQEVNRARFAERWRERLAAVHPPAEESEERVRTWRRRDAVAFYYPRPLTHDMDSGALRIYRLLGELRRRGHHVLLVSPEHDGPRLDGLHALGIETIRAAWGGDEAHLQLLGSNPPRVAVFCHTETEHRFAKSYHELSPATVRIFDTVDLAFLRETRRQALALGLHGEPAPDLDNIGRDGLAELAAARRSDITLVVSSHERELLTNSFFMSPERVRIVSNVHEPAPERRGHEERTGFVFLAGFAHPPNLDAVEWTVREIWPLIRGRLPDARLDVFGSQMPRSVRTLHDTAAGVLVHGYVADHRAALGAARVMLAPLRYGAGVKGKIGEALAVGTPTVTTPVGAEGMDEEGRALAIARQPAELAELAASLYGDADEWQRRSVAGLEILEQRFSTRANVDALLAAVSDGEDMRLTPSAAAVEMRLLWAEQGNPGEPYSLAMALQDALARGRPSLAGRVWRYYRAHGLRAVVRRSLDEVKARRARG